MKILINTATTNEGGSIQVAHSFLTELKFIKEHEYIVILSANLGKIINVKEFSNNFTFYKIDYRPGTRVFSFKNRTRFFKKIEKKHQPSVVFTTSGPAYWRPKAPHLVGYNLAHYIYPESIVFKRFSIKERFQWFLKGLFIRFFFMNDSDGFVCQTDDVTSRVKNLFKTDKVYTVANTCNSIYFQNYPLINKLPKELQSKEFRLLLLSTYYLHKNFEIIPKIIDELRIRKIKDIKFVLTISNEKIDTIFSKQQQKYIYCLGKIPLEECPTLYKECDVMFLPTLLECFSASYVEAMAMEKPILTSDLDFAHSICDDAAFYFNPVDALHITDQILILQKDKELYKKLIQKGKIRLKYFGTAKERAIKYLLYCEQLIS